MTSRRWLIILAILLVLGWSWFWGVDLVTDLVVRGVRLTTTDLDDDNQVPDSPESLAAAASAVVGQPVGVDEYACARMLRSEAGHGDDLSKFCLALVLVNDAAHLGWGLAQTLAFSSVATRVGHFGKQASRRFSTADDPYDSDLEIARHAIADHAAGNDLTSGARKFVSKTGWLTGNNYEDTVASWALEGLHPFQIDGVASTWVFFNAAGAA
jgi:hypothetical protein